MVPPCFTRGDLIFIPVMAQLDLTTEQWLTGIRNGERVLLSRAITLIESAVPAHREQALALLSACYPLSGSAMRIGITGSPGAGKSTTIENLGLQMLADNKKLAVLAVDPSSRISKGSILGDKTRMQQLSREASVFIRPTASGEHVGGVAAATRETIILLEAAGFDTILIETVGVGQGETAIYDMTDLFILLLIPGAGDELQGIKRGIMELADIILINKCDGDNVERAKLAAAEVRRAIHLFQSKTSEWPVCVELISGLEGRGIPELRHQIDKYFELTKHNGYLESNRIRQRESWFQDQLHYAILRSVSEHPQYHEWLKSAEADIQTGQLLPSLAVHTLLKKLFQA